VNAGLIAIDIAIGCTILSRLSLSIRLSETVVLEVLVLGLFAQLHIALDLLFQLLLF